MRYYAGKCGPAFACGVEQQAALRLGRGQGDAGLRPPARPSAARPLIERAIEQGVDFLFSVDPADAAYPSGWAAKPSGNWWKFGFPVFYVTDLLQIVEALVGAGLRPRPAPGARPRRSSARSRTPQGRWALEYDYAGKTWVDFGAKKQPNKWVTLRALRVLKAAAA